MRGPPPSRLVGVDVARGLALLGMIATHVLPGENPDDSLTWTNLVISGRAAALFAVLAGVGLALAYRLADPGELGSELLLTGSYPALAWTAYLLVGLAVGQLALRQPRVAATVAGVGAATAAVAAGISALLLGPLGGYDALAEVIRLSSGTTVEQEVDAGRFGNVPTDSPWWLATDAPHTTTPFDLIGTTGTALFVLGIALLLASRPGPVLTPLSAAGSMPLTLYTAHVTLLGTTDTDNPPATHCCR